MIAVILAGGFGTRLSEYTDEVPKPMVEVGGKPAILHIMDHYASYGVKNFVIAGGYKCEIIKQFFVGLGHYETDIVIDSERSSVSSLNNSPKRDWKITIVDTGYQTMTGGRLLRLRSLIGDQRFFITYGDGFCNVNLSKLLELHTAENATATVTAVRPTARFGELQLSENKVSSFEEKPQMNQGWINGGFFVMESEIFDFIQSDETVLEKEPLSRIAKKGKLAAYRHTGFWQCMDTKRDRDYLESLWRDGQAPWVKEH